MTSLYILDGHTPVREHDIRKWGEWMESADRHVAETTIGPLWISTVFLGLDHSFRGPPLLFETMIFGFDEHDSYQTRCSTWEEAERMHALAKDIAETLVQNATTTLNAFMGKLDIRNADTIA